MIYYERGKDTYSAAQTMKTDKAVITVHVPRLTERERERRLAIIREAAAALIFAAEEREEKCRIENVEC